VTVLAARPALRVRPRARRRELGLLVLVGLTLLVGSLGLGATATGRLATAGLGHLIVYWMALLAVHVALSLGGRRSDEVLLPAVGLLGGIGLLLMIRLPQDLVTQRLGGLDLGLADLQLAWLVLALGIAGTLGLLVRSDRWLRLYKYSWALGGITLLLLTFVFGEDTNGARLSLSVGPFTGQPSELLKVILVVFFAAYLAENRPLLADARTRLVGPLSIPPVRYLLPILAMLAIALSIVVVQRDLGAALLFYVVFLVLFYAATGRLSDVALGIFLFAVGGVVLYVFFGHVRTRIDIWLDPWTDPLGAGYQTIQALHAFARGGILGTGLGAGLPVVGGRLPIPAIHTDFPLAALGEELGLVGVLGLLGLYLVVVERGLRIGAAAADDFRALLAVGLSAVIAVQAFIIAGGVLKIVPLTGITLPFISYGGSSLLANALVVGLLLAFSQGEAPEPPPAPRAKGRLDRLLGREAAR
jgi:cell division protein FtsW (lipid II flippase)